MDHPHFALATIPTSRYPRYRGFPDASPADAADDAAMLWAVTTQGDLPDDYESRDHPESVPAWDDYWGRILELEIHGYTQESEGAAEYGKRWLCELSRGAEQISVTIERTA